MTVRTVLKMGHPLLMKPSKPVSAFDTPELQTIIHDLEDSMRHYQGVGIAAPQIGIDQQIMLFGFDKNPRYPNEAAVPKTILINPVVTALTEAEDEYWEGCLSVPGIRGLVSRPTRIRYTGYTAEATLIEKSVSGFHARVVQHEYDHLNGMLFPYRIQDPRKLAYTDELDKLSEQQKADIF